MEKNKRRNAAEESVSGEPCGGSFAIISAKQGGCNVL
jgi:hypothetical protein